MALISGIPDVKSSQGKSKRVYVKGSVVDFEEDFEHEFKGHANLGVEDIPEWCFIPGTNRRSRRAVSRNLNGLINTGKAGTVYLGIVDDGTVKGIHRSRYQKDHMILAMKDLMGRYSPPVDSSRYKIEFVPVVDEEGDSAPEDDNESFKTNPDRLKPHLLRTAEFCWCDRDLQAQFNLGLTCPAYIIEISILSYEDKLVKTENDEYKLQLHPVHQDEEGKCYFKRLASCVPYSLEEVKGFTVEEVREHYHPVIQSLRKEVAELRRQLADI